jgi:hypothetical protein
MKHEIGGASTMNGNAKFVDFLGKPDGKTEV